MTTSRLFQAGGHIHDLSHLLQAQAANVRVGGPGPDIHERRVHRVAGKSRTRSSRCRVMALGVKSLQFFGTDVDFGAGFQCEEQRRFSGQALAGDADEQVLKHCCPPAAG